MRNRGYTLVELLVVIAIIAILAAMIMPVMLEAKEAAKMKRCVSNLRQLGAAVMQYMDDNSGYGLPQAPAEPVHSYDNPWILYVRPLQPYLGQKVLLPSPDGMTGWDHPKRIWICEGDICRGTAYNDRPCWYHWGSSYLYPGNTAYISPAPSVPNNPTKKAADAVPRKPLMWRTPRRDILLADYWYDFHSGYRVPKDLKNPEITSSATWINKKDAKTMNVLFLDMHAASVNAAQREEYINNTIFLDNPFAKSIFN